MESYDWQEFKEFHWLERYPGWALGSEEWSRQPWPEGWFEQDQEGPLPRVPDWLPDLSLRDLVDRESGHTPLKCPSVFISHRYADRAPAERVAWLAQQEGLDYWLDIHDPRLRCLSPHLTGLQRALAIAAIIEMALLNCSHIVALITPNTPGTMWIPYEYGRVKELPPVSIQAACYQHPSMPDRQLPEYLHLGVVRKTDDQVRRWLRASRAAWVKAFGKCDSFRPDWKGDEPKPLPSD